ncbi:MAG: type II toxin-antitoxin system ParD family antitoxin [Algicola sp.]|nr:type II toxin-antitoxin system ParD family antitoxin [Algicola sp.]
MNISLTPELESRVRAKVEGGLYNNASEVVREALRFMDTHDEWVKELKLQQLRAQLKEGTDQLSRGEGIAIGSEAELDNFFQDIIR